MRATLFTTTLALYMAIVGAGCSTAQIRRYESERASIEGKILADLHTHPPKNKSLETILEVLSSGVVGLAAINGNTKILRYEDTLAFPGVTEIDAGRFAKAEHEGKTGYVIKCQEIIEDSYHLLAVGITRYIPYITEELTQLEKLRNYVELIHAQGGLAVLAHPCVTRNGGIIPFREIKPEEESSVRDRCQEVDAVEVHNMQVANVFFVSLYSANAYAADLAAEVYKPGIAVSDALTWNPVLASGIAVPKEGLSYDVFRDYVSRGDFTTVANKHTSLSFIWDNGHIARNKIVETLISGMLFLPKHLYYILVYCPSEQKQ